jgi:hypothetical protein
VATSQSTSHSGRSENVAVVKSLNGHFKQVLIKQEKQIRKKRSDAGHPRGPRSSASKSKSTTPIVSNASADDMSDRSMFVDLSLDDDDDDGVADRYFWSRCKPTPPGLVIDMTGNDVASDDDNDDDDDDDSRRGRSGKTHLD